MIEVKFPFTQQRTNRRKKQLYISLNCISPKLENDKDASYNRMKASFFFLTLNELISLSTSIPQPILARGRKHYRACLSSIAFSPQGFLSDLNLRSALSTLLQRNFFAKAIDCVTTSIVVYPNGYTLTGFADKGSHVSAAESCIPQRLR